MRGLEPKKQKADRVRPFVEKHKEISLKSHGWLFLHHTAVFRAHARVLLVGTERTKGKRKGATWVKVTSIYTRLSVRLATGEPSRLNIPVTGQTDNMSALWKPEKENRGRWCGRAWRVMSQKHSFVLKTVTNTTCSQLD